jgi:hypothetical protein
MEFTFAIENLELQKVSTQKIIADSVPAAWEKMNTLIKPEEEATLVYIGSTQVGEILHEYLITSFA